VPFERISSSESVLGDEATSPLLYEDTI